MPSWTDHSTGMPRRDVGPDGVGPFVHLGRDPARASFSTSRPHCPRSRTSHNHSPPSPFFNLGRRGWAFSRFRKSRVSVRESSTLIRIWKRPYLFRFSAIAAVLVPPSAEELARKQVRAGPRNPFRNRQKSGRRSPPRTPFCPWLPWECPG